MGYIFPDLLSSRVFWLLDPFFPRVVSEVWGGSCHLKDAIDRFAKNASEWNKSHFGNIIGRKKRTMERLHGVQKTLTRSPSHSLLELEENLHKELNNILSQ